MKGGASENKVTDMTSPSSPSQPFRILSIDGGGIRGIYPAHILQRIQDEFRLNLSEYFDLIAGTSTGSIIAAALAVEYPIAKVVRLYEEKGKQIFSRNILGLGGFISSRYSNSGLKQELDKAFRNKTLSDTKTRLVIPATDIGNGCVHIIKSNYDPTFIRDPKRKISDAVLSSCSAPTYFAPHDSDGYLLADGGLWANNPSLIALTEAITRLNISKENITLLSIGTGIGEKFYPQNASKRFPWNWSWGLATRWKGMKLIDSILNLQIKSNENILGLILNQKNYLRINFSSHKALSLSDINSVHDLKSKAEDDFRIHAPKIRELLETGK